MPSIEVSNNTKNIISVKLPSRSKSRRPVRYCLSGAVSASAWILGVASVDDCSGIVLGLGLDVGDDIRKERQSSFDTASN